MATLVGNHTQSSTGRTFHYRVVFERVSSCEAYFAAIVSEPCHGPWGGLERGGAVEGRVPVDPECVPVELAIRSRVLSHIEATDFGQWKPPPATWPGWYGPYL